MAYNRVSYPAEQAMARGFEQEDYPVPDMAADVAELSRAAEDLRSSRVQLADSEENYKRAVQRWVNAKRDTEHFVKMNDEAWGDGYVRPDEVCKAVG